LGINAGAKIMVSKCEDSGQRGKIIKSCLKVRMISAVIISLAITTSSGWWISYFVDENGSYGVLYPVLPLIGFMVFSGTVLEFYKQLGYRMPDLKFTFFPYTILWSYGRGCFNFDNGNF